MEWLSDNWTWILFYLLTVNVFAVIASIVIIISLPTHYLVADLEPKTHPILASLRNITGITLIIAGLMMLVLPGPGVLTIFCGLVTLHSQKKQALLLKLTASSKIRVQMQSIRKRFARPELEFPQG